MQSEQPQSPSPGRRRPPLPPRRTNESSQQTRDDAPPPYDLVAHQRRAYDKATASNPSHAGDSLMHNDPRSSSQDSLGVEPAAQDRRRSLLLVYVHGFMGNETSFRSFPAHVHNLLSVLLGESHSIRTKIYPRYRSKGRITIARNDFSKWLEPHEAPSTDVVLLGHSMGGLLIAEVALMPSLNPGAQPLKHRILGTVNFDVPFLGMHPGVVRSGLSSIFNSTEEVDDRWEDRPQQSSSTDLSSQTDAAGPPPSRMDTFWGQTDPNFNPKFANDVALPIRKGWRNAWHFINKHSDDLLQSTKKLVASHMEFGGAMANYGELKTRYAKIRALEEEDSHVRQTVIEGGVPPRVRFTNYYTASTGRPKKSNSPLRRSSPSPHKSRTSSKASTSRNSLHSLEAQGVKTERSSTAGSRSSSTCPDTTISQELLVASQDEDWNGAMESLSIGGSGSQQSSFAQTSASTSHQQPPPELTPVPPLGDLGYIQDEKIRKLVADEHARAVETYEKAVKERATIPQLQDTNYDSVEAAPKSQIQVSEGKQPEREKPESEMTHAEREKVRLEKEKQRMEAEGRRLRGEPEPGPQPADSRRSIGSLPRMDSYAPSIPASTIGSTSTYDSSLLTPQQSTDTASTTTTTSATPRKERKFCNLPPKDKNGERDPCWVRVFMQNVDEVGAHCGLFFVDERYERLVGDVAERIEQWVLEGDTAKRSGTENPRQPGKTG